VPSAINPGMLDLYTSIVSPLTVFTDTLGSDVGAEALVFNPVFRVDDAGDVTTGAVTTGLIGLLFNPVATLLLEPELLDPAPVVASFGWLKAV